MTASRNAPPATHIKTRQLVLLTHLDRERSLLRAAQAAGMSQPAATKLLRDLEEELGMPLFERHARGVEPNACGEIVMRHAHAALNELRRAREEVEALRQGGHYRVALGSVMSPATELLPRALALLAERHPRLAVSVEIDTSRRLTQGLLEGRLDLLIGRVVDAHTAPELAFEPLADEPHSLIARAGHPLAQRQGLRLEDLVEQAWVMPPPGSMVRERLDALFLQHGLRLPARRVETLSVPLTMHLLRHSDMLVALPEDVVRPYCDAGLLAVLPMALDVRLAAYGLITRRDRPLSPHAQEALRVLRELHAAA